MVERLVVVLEHGELQAVGVHLQPLGQELPREQDCLALEVVAEAEVAQHLKKGQVRQVADRFDVGGAQAFLHGGHARCGGLRYAQKVGLELHHARAGEQQRRVFRHEAVRGQQQVPFILKVAQKCPSQRARVPVHRSLHYSTG
jgi:hypothetical protein